MILDLCLVLEVDGIEWWLMGAQETWLLTY